MISGRDDLAAKAMISTFGQSPELNEKGRGAKITRVSAKEILLNI
jgi:hypothetical protein